MSLSDELGRIPGASIVDRQSRILILDIERLPGQAWAFDQKTKFISHRNFITSPRTICFAARWYGHRRPIFHAEWKDADQMVAESWKLCDEADIIVGYNHVGFDMKHLKSAWLEAGLPPPRPWKDVDLYRVVSRQFGFLSKSLDYVSRQLGFDGKVTHYSIDLAHAAVAGDRGSQAALRSYNVADVELTEALYDRLRGWIPTHPHMGVWGDEKRCPQCGSPDLRLQPTRYRAVLLDYALYRCGGCRGNVRGAWVSRAASTRGVS